MSEEELADTRISFNPKVCALLRRGQGPSVPAVSPESERLKRRVGSAVVQRLRQANYQLAVEEFLREPNAPPRVPQEAALNYFVHRTYNSLRSREMLAREAKEAARLRREPYAQSLAKDISRRHFRTAAHFNTGSKYPPDGDPDLHSRAAQDPVLTLLRSRKLLAMADVLLTHPGSLRVGPQLRSSTDIDAIPDRHCGGDDTEARGAVADDLGQQWGSSATADERTNVTASVPAELGVPSLDATRYALALFSPRHGYRVPEERSSCKDPVPDELIRGLGRSGARQAQARRVEVLQARDDSGQGGAEGGGSDQLPARGRRGAGNEALSLVEVEAEDEEETEEREESQGPSADDSSDRGTEAMKTAVGSAGRAAKEEGQGVGGGCVQAAETEGGPQQEPVGGAQPSSQGAASSKGSYHESDTAGDAPVLPGADRAGVPVAVRQQLLADRLQEMLAGSRGLLAQAESVLGTAGSSPGDWTGDVRSTPLGDTS